MTGSRAALHFKRLYQSNPDPWGFRTSAYEQTKYRQTVSTPGDQHFTSGLEVGCSIGVLTRLLAVRCASLLGVDIVEDPLEAARSRCADQPQVRFQRMQVPAEWPDERFWDEVAVRLGARAGGQITRGPSIEKSLAPLRSFVAEPMRWKRLFLAGDAAHIVPPTGAKGLNLAASDVHFLSEALTAFYRTGEPAELDAYSDKALARVWKAERFSWWFTGLTHRFPGMDPIERRLQMAELDYIRGSRTAQAVVAENYVGLELETP